MPSEHDYNNSPEWKGTEATVARSMGFRIVHSGGDNYSIQLLDFPPPELKEKVRATQPTTQMMYDLWREVVRYRIDHDGACRLAWDLYSAALGTTVETFNGMSAGGPVKAVKAERSRLLEAARQTAARASEPTQPHASR